MKALVVDDSRAMRMILSRTLSALGFEVSGAASGNEALELFEREGGPPPLVLVDWNMPGISGLELIRRIRTGKSPAASTLIMVTSETDVAQMAVALEAGADEYVMKPFSGDVIEGKLRLLGLVA